jgi:hypothetical protein
MTLLLTISHCSVPGVTGSLSLSLMTAPRLYLLL